MKFNWIMKLENGGFIGGDNITGGKLVEDYSKARRFDSIDAALLFLRAYWPEKEESLFSAIFTDTVGGKGCITIHGDI